MIPRYAEVSAVSGSDRRAVSEAGRRALADAVAVDHDWSLPISGVDRLIAAAEELDDADLAAADLLAYYLADAIGTVRTRRAMREEIGSRVHDGQSTVDGAGC